MNTITCNKSYGPVFGDTKADIAISDKCNKNCSSFCNPN